MVVGLIMSCDVIVNCCCIVVRLIFWLVRFVKVILFWCCCCCILLKVRLRLSLCWFEVSKFVINVRIWFVVMFSVKCFVSWVGVLRV